MRRLVTVVLCVILAAPLSHVGAACGSPTQTGEPATMTEVYGETDWYRARPEPEEEFRGALQRHQVVAGPAARTALRYSLVTEAGSLAVYAPGTGETLEPFVGRRVVVEGKLVDLSAEGLGTELWIGSIRPTDADR